MQNTLFEILSDQEILTRCLPEQLQQGALPSHDPEFSGLSETRGKRHSRVLIAGSSSSLLKAGAAVNIPADASGQSLAHLAACGSEAFFLLWQLQTRANLNQQDHLGEAPIHKAAKVGSLECLALLVAGDAKIDLGNNSGQTTADLALAYSFLEGAKFLTTIQHLQTMKLRQQPGYTLRDKQGLLRGEPAAQKQEHEITRSTSRKRRRSDSVLRSQTKCSLEYF